MTISIAEAEKRSDISFRVYPAENGWTLNVDAWDGMNGQWIGRERYVFNSDADLLVRMGHIVNEVETAHPVEDA